MTNESYAPEYPEQNIVGLVGFIVSLLGIFSAGILSPVGMIISLVGLSKSPRGFATAGVVIGLVGTLLFFLWVIVVIAVLSIGALAVGLFLLVNEFGIMWIETGFDAFKMNEAIVAYEDENGALPASISELSLTEDVLIDYWGNPYLVQIDEVDRQLKIRSLGEDGVQDTEDDHVLSMSFAFAQEDFDWDDLDEGVITIGEDKDDASQ